MDKYLRSKTFTVVIFLICSSIACKFFSSAEEPAPTKTNVPAESVPTLTEIPPSEPSPTFTPRPTSTSEIDPLEVELLERVQEFADEGLIESTEGEYIDFEDFVESWPQLGWYQWWEFEDLRLRNFVFLAKFRWSSALSTAEVSGCGIIFAINGEDHHYGMFLDKSRIQFTCADARYWYEVGKSRGTGRVNFGNPAEAEVAFVVNEYKAYVYVDKEFIGEYALSKDKPLEGGMGFSVLSGTNKDYGTRCEITDARLLSLNP